MPLSWNEIRDRAQHFAREWKHTENEDAEGKSFLDAFFQVFGLQRRKVASFEQRVKKLDQRDGYIDLLWKGTLLVEQKSRGKSLTRAYRQAIDYFPGLTDDELPRYILVSDFWNFELHDLDEDRIHKFELKELPRRIHLFHFIAGYRKQRVRDEDPINRRAADAVGDLHDALKQDGFDGHRLEVFLVRLLFCLFADDTGIFQPKDLFADLIEFHSREDGSDLGAVLDTLFATLNRPSHERQRSLAEHYAAFPYINGHLFEERMEPPAFNATMRRQLLALTRIQWGQISPAIFGAMFQKVMELDAKARRRELGAHYTSEANILRLIGPLFLDELRAELQACKAHKNQLFEFHKKLQALAFLDPACGCGNFLVVAYRELRRLELDVLRAASHFGQQVGHVFDFLRVDVDQFHGIEIEEFPAQIAQVAMWLTDHQMNVEAGEEFGEPMLRIPLVKSAHIRHGNALRLDWAAFVPPRRLSFILGNPPFIGKQHQRAEQKADLATVTQGMAGAGVLDFVAGWYVKAANYLTTVPNSFDGIATQAAAGRRRFKDVRFGREQAGLGDLFADADALEATQRRAVRCAFVSTNSIIQGEQVGVLWRWMLDRGLHIRFAHRTFKWTNEAPGRAAVHCVILGFGVDDGKPLRKRLFEYPEIDKAPLEISAQNINPYLADAPDVVLPKRQQPLVGDVPLISFGSMPNDGGHLLLTDAEKHALLAAEPQAAPWVRPFLGADEFLNRIPRWCLWLVGCPPDVLRKLPQVAGRVSATRAYREASTRAATRKLADYASLFGEDRQPRGDYVLVPRHSSERRAFIPMGFLPADVICGDANLCIAQAGIYHFGVLSSTMHNAWVRYTCGRLKSDFRYSAGIVYNNFPWPLAPDERQRAAVVAAADAVLAARAEHADASLADLYDPNTMPPNLVTAHRELDRAVDAAYLARLPVGMTLKPKLDSDGRRVAFLFTMYAALTTLAAAPG
ncbi:MAG: methylase [Burkholderiales bacterium RIFCSPHIGHO2_12_FULL_69_20]|nr:MAG: methylase [Burkholderiales bacterium RIFCSPHIGHO2_12_FULL_69_20]